MKVNIYEGFESFSIHSNDSTPPEIAVAVRGIVEGVRERGDAALLEYTEKFDGVKLASLRVPQDEMTRALAGVSAEMQAIIREATKNVRDFHQRQVRETQLDFSPDGTILGWKVSAVDAAGLYVPGGRAVYPSTVIMNVVPAQVAGVPRIVVVSPPGPNGLPNDLVLATLAILEVEDVYAVGGAQAVAALAHGTETIDRVCKITGPGNAYVSEAKRQVYGLVGIDSIAGPSEIMIVCDQENMPTEYLVQDLLSQAEHDPMARSLLATTSRKQAEAVAERLKELVPTLQRREIIEASFEDHSAIIVVKDLDEAWSAVNELAPEHLEVLTASPMDELHKIRNAGAIFLGPNTPEPVGDYFAGPNHTLPTNGCAKFSSPLGVADFTKSSSVLSYSAARLAKDGPSIVKFAEEEGLFAHAASVKVRLKD